MLTLNSTVSAFHNILLNRIIAFIGKLYDFDGDFIFASNVMFYNMDTDGDDKK